MKKGLLRAVVCLSFVLIMLAIICVSANALENDEPERYGRTTILTEQNVLTVYDSLVDGLMPLSTPETIYFGRSVTEQDVEKALYIFFSDYPECFWLANNYSLVFTGGTSSIIGIKLQYLFTGSTLTAKKSEMDVAIAEFMSGMPQNGSNYDKALYLHDAIVEKVSYELQSKYNQSAYSALVNRVSVCAGYAKSYQLLLREAGIQAWTVTGTSKGQSHAWNVVWMDDNTCVYTDVTWDDQTPETYRCYFNISKTEISTDHTVNASLFTLPACGHDDLSYFDANPKYVLKSDSSVEDIAALFLPSADGTTRKATIYDPNGFISNWWYYNGWNLYLALGGDPNVDPSPSISGLSGAAEYRFTLSGDFTLEACTVTVGTSDANTNKKIALDANFGSGNQTVAFGEAIEDIYVLVAEGYYFPTNYSVNAGNGITVERISYTKLKISGTPTGSVSIIIPAPTAKTKAASPTSVVFTATGSSTGTLSGVSSGMQYRVGYSGAWKNVTSAANISLSNLSACTICVKRLGDETMYDSDIYFISVTKATKPSLTPTQPSTVGGKGKIPTTAAHEYSKNQSTWTACSGALNNLNAGTYYVRVKASGTKLASDAQVITINSFTVTTVEVSGVTIDETLSLYIGGSATPSYTVSPGNADNKAVTFSSNNTAVATVNATTGEITAIAKGTAIITVTTVDGGYSDTCEVTVSCNHVFNSEWKHNDDKHWKECDCGEEDTRTDHSFGQWSVIEEASPEKDGTKKRSCECGYYETDTVPYVPTQSGDGNGDGDGQNGGNGDGGNTGNGGGDGSSTPDNTPSNTPENNTNGENGNESAEGGENSPSEEPDATEAMTEISSDETADATEELGEQTELIGCQSNAGVSGVMLLVVAMLIFVACIPHKRKEN